MMGLDKATLEIIIQLQNLSNANCDNILFKSTLVYTKQWLPKIRAVIPVLHNMLHLK